MRDEPNHLDLEAYRVSRDARNQEIVLFWQRSNYFLVLSTAIAAGFFSLRESSLRYAVPLAVFGLVVGLLWIAVTLGSKFWQARWENRLRIVEERLEPGMNLFSATWETVQRDVEESFEFRRRGVIHRFYSRLVFLKPSVSLMMTLLSVCFVAFWIALLVVAVAVGSTGAKEQQGGRTEPLDGKGLDSPVAQQGSAPIVRLRPTPGAELLLGLLRDAFSSIAAARDTGADAAKIPPAALSEYIKGLSGEAGKKTTDLFAYLATLPFEPSGDPEKDRQVLAAILITDIIGYQPPPARVGVLLTEQVFFAPDRSDLAESAYAAIDHVKLIAQQERESIVLLFGNTDTTGAASRNAELAKLRSAAVRNVLVSRGGIAANRVFASELADRALPRVTPPATSEERNRSVTIQVLR